MHTLHYLGNIKLNHGLLLFLVYGLHDMDPSLRPTVDATTHKSNPQPRHFSIKYGWDSPSIYLVQNLPEGDHLEEGRDAVRLVGCSWSGSCFRYGYERRC
jgi:hypothetical protein